MRKLQKVKWQLGMEEYIGGYNSSGIQDSIKQALGAFFRHITTSTNLSTNTIRIRYACLSVFERWLSENLITDINNIDNHTIRDYLTYCRDVRGQQYSMLKCSKVALRHFFGVLHDMNIILVNPALKVVITTQPKHSDFQILSRNELLSLINAADRRLTSYVENCHKDKRHVFYAHRDIAMLFVLCSTGIRTEELCMIKLSDIELNKGVINISGKGNNLYICRHRQVYIDIPQVIDAIEAFLKIRTQTATDALFCSWEGNHVKSAAVIASVKNIGKSADLPLNITPFTLRHTFCSSMAHNGADPFSVRKLMGHKKILTTLHYYTHFNNEQLRTVNSSFNLLSGGML